MNPRIKALWVEALRSKEYPQTKGKLKTQDGYCCLGVLCDLYLKEHSEEWKSSDFIEDDEILSYVIDSCDNLPPESVVEWAELPCDNPGVMIDGVNYVTDLTELNDSLCMNFEEISDYIENQL